MKAVEQLIVTFTCNNNVHVYYEKSGVLPMRPFKSHNSIEAAVKYLKENRNVSNPEIIVKKMKPLNQNKL
jgi:hypothetical protein